MCKILFVDDEPEYAEPQKEALEDEGYSVTFAIGPGEAMEWLHKKSFELIILDLLMPPRELDSEADPVETGLKLYQEIRQQEKFKKIPIIFLSVVRDLEVIAQLTEEERTNGHELKRLAKPALPSDVVSLVQKTLSA
jgi:CheY-like chemotaxis protein